MAFDVMVTGVAKDTGETLLEINPVVWWDTDALVNSNRFTVSNETGSYADFDADLSHEEMRVIHEYSRPAATSGVFEGEEWQESIQPEMKQLDQALYKQSDRYHHFHVTVYEWESGF